eukprot:1164580-Prymnesium_polylepis.1
MGKHPEREVMAQPVPEAQGVVRKDQGEELHLFGEEAERGRARAPHMVRKLLRRVHDAKRQPLAVHWHASAAVRRVTEFLHEGLSNHGTVFTLECAAAPGPTHVAANTSLRTQ